MKIINYFENYNHKRKQVIEPVDKPIKKPDVSFKEILENEYRKDKRRIGNII
jgi:hypothetical protein